MDTTEEAAVETDGEQIQVEQDKETTGQNSKKYFEGQGGQKKVAYHMIVEGIKRTDASHMLKVIHKILKKMRAYDTSLVVLTENKDVLNLKKL